MLNFKSVAKLFGLWIFQVCARMCVCVWEGMRFLLPICTELFGPFSLGLASESIEKGELLWKVRPKYHKFRGSHICSTLVMMSCLHTVQFPWGWTIYAMTVLKLHLHYVFRATRMRMLWDRSRDWHEKLILWGLMYRSCNGIALTVAVAGYGNWPCNHARSTSGLLVAKVAGVVRSCCLQVWTNTGVHMVYIWHNHLNIDQFTWSWKFT